MVGSLKEDFIKIVLIILCFQKFCLEKYIFPPNKKCS